MNDLETEQIFVLDKTLANDCFVLSDSEQFVVLLMNNRIIPWFILVPKTDKTELYQLDMSLQQQCLQQIQAISEFIQQQYPIDKLNIAAIGNVVKQLHIHIVGRYYSDPFWPGVVWGRTEKEIYTLEEVKTIQNHFLNQK